MFQRLDLDPVRETLLLTLYAKALDSRLTRPILADNCSADIADRIDYDFARLKANPSLVCSTALRTKLLDRAVRAFMTRHPDAVVVDLGCGFGPRVVRCNPPAGVDWYDVDFPDVIQYRECFLPGRSRLVGADLTTSDWLDPLPHDRPTMIIAEGHEKSARAICWWSGFKMLGNALFNDSRGDLAGVSFHLNAFQIAAQQRGWL